MSHHHNFCDGPKDRRATENTRESPSTSRGETRFLPDIFAVEERQKFKKLWEGRRISGDAELDFVGWFLFCNKDRTVSIWSAFNFLPSTEEQENTWAKLRESVALQGASHAT